VVAEVKASPEEHGDVDRGKDVAEEWVADAQVGSDSAAEIGGQQDCAEYGGTRNRIEDNTDEQDDPDTENQAYGISEASGTLHGRSEPQYFDGAVEEQEQYDQSAEDASGPEHLFRSGSSLSIRDGSRLSTRLHESFLLMLMVAG